MVIQWTHILFVCNSGIIKVKVMNNSNFTKSIEYRWLKIIISPMWICESIATKFVKRLPVMKPTFDRFLRLTGKIW